MKKILVAFLMVLCLTGTAVAQNITATWSFTPPTDKTTSGFRLYRDGTMVCQTLVPTARSLECDIPFTKSVNDFTLTATYSDNTESPHSPKYTYNWLPTPSIIKIEFK